MCNCGKCFKCRQKNFNEDVVATKEYVDDMNFTSRVEDSNGNTVKYKNNIPLDDIGQNDMNLVPYAYVNQTENSIIDIVAELGDIVSTKNQLISLKGKKQDNTNLQIDDPKVILFNTGITVDQGSDPKTFIVNSQSSGAITGISITDGTTQLANQTGISFNDPSKSNSPFKISNNKILIKNIYALGLTTRVGTEDGNLFIGLTSGSMPSISLSDYTGTSGNEVLKYDATSKTITLKDSSNNVILISDGTTGKINYHNYEIATINSDNLTNYTKTSELNKTLVGLDNVDNTPDLQKPVSVAQQNALNLKQNINDLSLNTTAKNIVPAINELKTNIDTNTTNISLKANQTDLNTTNTNLSTEITNRTNADTNLQNQINTLNNLTIIQNFYTTNHQISLLVLGVATAVIKAKCSFKKGNNIYNLGSINTAQVNTQTFTIADWGTTWRVYLSSSASTTLGTNLTATITNGTKTLQSVDTISMSFPNTSTLLITFRDNTTTPATISFDISSLS